MTTYETKDYIENVIKHLEPEEAEIIRMRFWYNMTLNEIGKEIGVCGSAIGQRIFRTLKKCRSHIVKVIDRPVVNLEEVNAHNLNSHLVVHKDTSPVLTSIEGILESIAKAKPLS